MREKYSFWKILSSKILFVFLFLFLIFLGLATGKITAKRNKVNNDIKNLKKEIEDIENQNNNLTSMIEYLDTMSFKEKEARLKLGLQKEGEKTVIITSPYSELQTKEEEEKNTEEPKYSNTLRWWKYFFDRDK